MGSNSKELIEHAAFTIFARGGYEALTMRNLAKESGVTLSSIYHFFTDKDVLLKHLFSKINKQLGSDRAQLPNRRTAEQMLRDRVEFQFKHIAEVVFVLKYYLHYRPEFMRLESGFIPEKGYLHIDEVVKKGIETKEYVIDDPETETKIVAHAINGFLLEYFPDPPTGRELKKLSDDISQFLHRSLSYERRIHEVNSVRK